MKFDFTTFGETMIRVSVRPGQTLETANQADLYTAGTESNTAVALSRLGMKTAWVSRLTDDVLGRRIEADIARHGVDTRGVIWTKKDRAGTFYVQFATPPRVASVTYDRRHSAISKLKSQDLNWEFLLNTRILHLTGITPALSPSCRQAAADAIRKAKARKISVSFDVNYRAKLWEPQAAAETLSPLLQDSTLAIMTKEDAAVVFKFKGEPKQVVKKIREHFHPQIAVLTRGHNGAIAWDGTKLFAEPGFPIPVVVDRLGAGDAFTAGLIYGFLQGNLPLGLKYGITMSAMKMGMLGDYFWADRDEVEKVMKSRSGDVHR